MTPISWAELVEHPQGAIPFLIDPYVPEGGIILLYGKTRIGKSPLTWEIARCIGTGEPFFGCPTRQGRVLYLEFDTPRRLVQPRLELLEPAPNVWWEFPPACHIVNSSLQARFRLMHDEIKPDLVIVNTLRSVYVGDEKDAAMPIRIYQTFQALFPGAAIWLNHHDKKTRGEVEAKGTDPDEDFSGHMAWLNHCQTGLHLVGAGNRYQSGLLKLVHSKSQVSEMALPLTLQLDRDGSHVTDYSAKTLQNILQVYHALEGLKTQRVPLVAKHLGCSERTVWTYLSRLPDVPESPY